MKDGASKNDKGVTALQEKIVEYNSHLQLLERQRDALAQKVELARIKSQQHADQVDKLNKLILTERNARERVETCLQEKLADTESRYNQLKEDAGLDIAYVYNRMLINADFKRRRRRGRKPSQHKFMAPLSHAVPSSDTGTHNYPSPAQPDSRIRRLRASLYSSSFMQYVPATWRLRQSIAMTEAHLARNQCALIFIFSFLCMLILGTAAVYMSD